MKKVGGVRVTVAKVEGPSWEMRDTSRPGPWPREGQTKPTNGPDPRSEEFAAWYVAGLICHGAKHDHPYGDWPCAESQNAALDGVHLLVKKGVRDAQKSGKSYGKPREKR